MIRCARLASLTAWYSRALAPESDSGRPRRRCPRVLLVQPAAPLLAERDQLGDLVAPGLRAALGVALAGAVLVALLGGAAFALVRRRVDGTAQHTGI